MLVLEILIGSKDACLVRLPHFGRITREDRRQKTEDGRQKTEDGRQKTEDRRRLPRETAVLWQDNEGRRKTE
jgi:hypothetical protein